MTSNDTREAVDSAYCFPGPYLPGSPLTKLHHRQAQIEDGIQYIMESWQCTEVLYLRIPKEQYAFD
jgi:hypothetical protein